MVENAAPNAAYVLYMFACLGLFALVYLVSAFDLRGVGRVRRRRSELSADEAEYAEPSLGGARTSARAEAILIIPRADLVVLTTLLALGGVALAGALGFLGPRLIDQFLGRGESWFFVGSWTGAAPLERVSQVAGGLCGALIGLRMLRLFMALAALLALVLVAMAATSFVLGRAFVA